MQLYPKKFEFITQNHQILCELYPPHHLTKKRKISITLTPNTILRIRAPKQTAHKNILAVLEKHKDWIAQQIDKQQTKQQQAKPLQFIQNEAHLFMGQYYTLDIEENIRKKQGINVLDHSLHITTHHNTPHKIFALIDSWYRFQALDLFSKRLLLIQPSIPWIDWVNTPPILRIKKMTSRWGSYTNRKPDILTLNQHLIKAPLNCIDYVILHELCHAMEANHSKRFYALIAQVMPNWKKYHSQLQHLGSLLLYNTSPKGQN